MSVMATMPRLLGEEDPNACSISASMLTLPSSDLYAEKRSSYDMVTTSSWLFVIVAV